MRPLTNLLAPEVLRAALAAVALACAGPLAHAEKADRTKPMSVTSAGDHPDVLDLKKHSAVFTGNVVITQGTLEIHADRVEVSQDPDGNQLGYAFGSSTKPATFRQKRDGADEYSEGDAQKIEYDSAANRVRFVGAAHLRMLKGTAVTDTASAALITYDTASETILLTGGGSSSAGNAGGTTQKTSDGRTTITFTPKASNAPKDVEPLRLPTPASGPAK
jgi:lipopolysaccharide export system protein LptA